LTDTDTAVAISEEIVDEDNDLNDEARYADSGYKAAKESRAEAYASLNRFRWEMTECELGPRFSQRDYAKAVGVSNATISRAAAAWRIVMEKNPDEPTCAFGGEPHHGRPAEKPTEGQTDSHEQAKHTVSVGEVKTIIIQILAELFGVATVTVERAYRPEVKEVETRFHTARTGDLNEEDARAAIEPIARAVHADHKLAIRRAGEVKRWMSANRGVEESDITKKDLTEMMFRIEEMVKYEGTWAKAAAKVKASDRKMMEAERVKNELARAARIAVLDLLEAVVKVKAAAKSVVTAIKRIDTDEIPMSDDERTVILSDLIEADAEIHMARTLLGDEAETDWDAAAAALAD
jgi:hypothetical protein